MPILLPLPPDCGHERCDPPPPASFYSFLVFPCWWRPPRNLTTVPEHVLEKLGQALQAEIWKPGVGKEGWSLPAIQGHCEGEDKATEVSEGCFEENRAKRIKPFEPGRKAILSQRPILLPRLFNQLPGITCGVMVKAAPKSLPTAAGSGPPSML